MTTATEPLAPQMPGEDYATSSLPEVSSWIAIYEELGAVLVSIGARMDGDGERPAELTDQLGWVEERLASWRARHAELAGLVLDRADNLVVYAGRKLSLTRREAELLDFMLKHPQRPYTARQLSSLAWQNSWLADSQVRTYVMRLRHRLSKIGLDGVIRADRKRGYGVAAPPSEVAARPDRLVGTGTASSL